MTQPTPIRRSRRLDAALEAAERGRHVFPLRPDDKRPALHGEAHCPRLGDCASGHLKWEQRATTDPDRIRRAWASIPFNVGIATGPSGLVVVDLDMPKHKGSKGTPSGVTTLKALCERAGQAVPATYRTRTASGGEHLYFTAPPGIRLSNTAGALAPLVDTRAWGGYVVAAGSIVPSGSYTVADPRPVAPLPAWLLHALKPAERPAQPLRLALPKHGNRAAETALKRETALVAAAKEGGREAQLFESARKVARFVGWGDLTRQEVEQAFQMAGESAGLPASQCRSTLRSVLNWSLRNCRPREAT
ncbi:bifunctional DNA primase/polymerase [Streptomyces sp. NPDC002994]|uniref:bifunctional DNA primase/polymerase n=1 Tax=Streptomyces sp. NPDC002994 TaxID=3154441 RepID=UPI00339EEAC2